MPGLTAYSGITAILKVKAGNVLFVSAASGAVGSTACQIAKLKGATVIGSADGEEKCAFLREIGVDRVIDYKAVKDFTAALRQAAPGGIDCCFDNVRGSQLASAMEQPSRSHTSHYAVWCRSTTTEEASPQTSSTPSGNG